MTGSRTGAIGRAEKYVDDGTFEGVMSELVAVKTESQKFPDPAALAECHRYLDEYMGPIFTRMGFSLKKYDNPFAGQGPVLLATRIEDPSLPTVLGYGHGDVVLGMDDRWTKGKGPWITARDGDRLYGRGTADNKAQHVLNMAALEAVMAERGGKLGFNVKFMIETGEESGSKGLKELVAANKADFAADVLIASDGPRVRADRPTLALGCRGTLNFDLVVDLREGAHHSGNWGGLLANPGFILAHALTSIVGPKGELLVDALKAPAMSPAVKEVLADIEVGGGKGPSVDEWWGEPELKPAERVYAANTFNILAFTTGSPDKPVNAIPPKAVANCQLRFVTGGVTLDQIIPAVQAHLDAKGHTLVKVVPPPASNSGGFLATRTEPDHPWAAFAINSAQRSTNAKPAVIPSTGGSICNDIFTDVLGMPSIWIPHSYGACSQHAPDEHILIPLSRSAAQLMAGLYWDIGEGKGVPPRA